MGFEERNFDEKRDFYRMAVDCELTFSTTDGRKQGSGICRNLSAGGIAFDSKQALDAEVGIKVRIEPTSKITGALEALAQVVRCEPHPSGDGYQIAATILEISN